MRDNDLNIKNTKDGFIFSTQINITKEDVDRWIPLRYKLKRKIKHFIMKYFHKKRYLEYQEFLKESIDYLEKQLAYGDEINED